MTAGLITAEAVHRAPNEAPKESVDEDARYMAAALCLARRGLGRVAPNPSVGALIVKDGALVGRGVTGPGGRPHAETIALQNAGAAAAGATLYVTLEPCSHYGATPPCADAIIAAGIARVVSAMDDPDPRVRGQGHARLKASGLALRIGVGQAAAERLNLGHSLRVTRHRPMVTLKLAETADGYAAGGPGAPRLMITGEAANAYVHMQRTLYDAVLIGGGTARADDPQLTVRLPGLAAIKPLRIVFDSNLSLPLSAHLVVDAKEHPTLVVTTPNAAPEAEAALVARGVGVVRVASDAGNQVDLATAFNYLAVRGLTRIFCEGGPHLADALLVQGFVDEIMLLTSATALGTGVAALSAVARATLADASRFTCVEERMIGADRLRRYERRL